jgi:hypothetical protein
MLCLDDCLDFCELEQDEVEAIAEHEHVPVIVAAEIGCELLKSNDGVVLDDIELALAHGRTEHATELAMTYRHFQGAHPIPGYQVSSL